MTTSTQRSPKEEMPQQETHVLARYFEAKYGINAVSDVAADRISLLDVIILKSAFSEQAGRIYIDYDDETVEVEIVDKTTLAVRHPIFRRLKGTVDLERLLQRMKILPLQ